MMCDVMTGEPGAALVERQANLIREAGETAEAFAARAEALVSLA